MSGYIPRLPESFQSCWVNMTPPREIMGATHAVRNRVKQVFNILLVLLMLLLIPYFSAVLPILNGRVGAAGEDTHGLSESLNLMVRRRHFSALKIGEVLIWLHEVIGILAS